jgi:hypothetical protein
MRMNSQRSAKKELVFSYSHLVKTEMHHLVNFDPFIGQRMNN